MLPLPVPVPGGSVDELRELLPLTDSEWVLALGWLLGAFREKGVHFAAVFQGKGGTAKSTIAEMMLAVVDPCKPLKVRMNADPGQLLIQAHNRWGLLFDELTPLNLDKCAVLKDIITGTGYSTRSLYTNGEVFSFEVEAPVILTGHRNLLDDGPLLSRAIPFWRNEAVAPEKVIAPTDAKNRLQVALPRILGALLDMIVAGLKETDSGIPSSRHVRMTDAARWVAPCLKGSGMDPVDFLDALDAAHRLTEEITREHSNSSGAAVRESVATPSSAFQWAAFEALTDIAVEGFEGTATNLHALLTAHPEARADLCDWPKCASALSRGLNKFKDDLKAVGLFVEQLPRKGNERALKLSCSPSSAATVLPTSPTHAAVEGVTSARTKGNVQEEKLLAKIRRDFLSTAQQYPNLSKVYSRREGGYVLWGPLALTLAPKLGCAVQEGPWLITPLDELAAEVQSLNLAKDEKSAAPLTDSTKLLLVRADSLPDLQP